MGATLLERVLDVRLDDLLSHHKRRPQQPQALRTLQGALLFAQVQIDASWVPTPTRPTAAATAAPQQDALAQLDTGDARWRMLRLLLKLSEYGTPDGLVWLPARQEIGAMLDITVETASRLVAALKREGLLETPDARHARIAMPRLMAALREAGAET